MDLIWDGITEAVRLIFSGDKEVAEIVFLTLRVSGAATVLATVIGVPLGAVLGVWQFRGRGLLISIVKIGAVDLTSDTQLSIMNLHRDS